MTDQLLDRITTPNYQEIRQNFLNELILASEKKQSSIPFIKHILPDKPLLTQGIIQGIVLGGTNFILSTEEINAAGQRTVLSRETGILPQFKTKKVFIDFFLEHLDARADAIGLNFGFPLNPTTNAEGMLDGVVILKGTKDHSFTELTEPVGALLRTVFAKKFHKDVSISVANDTISLLLSGSGMEQAAFVNGTGFNMGLRMNPTVLVNLEAGEFDKFDHSDILKTIDRETKNPGKKLFEKRVSGLYLAKHFNLWAQRIGLMTTPVQTGQELSAIAHEYHDEIARDLARIILSQSASLVAAAVAAIYDFSLGQQICATDSPFQIIGEGGLLRDGWHYSEMLQKQLETFGLQQSEVRIKHIKNSSIEGAIGLITNSN